MIKRVKLGTFGMYEMEKAADKIIEICQNSEARWAQSFSVTDMETKEELIGFVELAIGGWIRPTIYNGSFCVESQFINRIEKNAIRS